MGQKGTTALGMMSEIVIEIDTGIEMGNGIEIEIGTEIETWTGIGIGTRIETESESETEKEKKREKGRGSETGPAGGKTTDGETIDVEIPIVRLLSRHDARLRDRLLVLKRQ